ncbi:hypothetical protein SS1G_03783 [Sclerotinia sclerotiorum 1980 UF-70]|uniref:CFEM domain-containing protein n=1 Tax=Sclerotinia sclerotiorum (strain ATCC 18683 / 1980 / Ss-1) TaxID=665079 RepID=A7EEP3_SCLS1|nr:hypothetical protein SS1G_03783 [Sclerotinia sclerotiorum 1980 UF-70]EDO01309.1 hypothetical protein SS1G_03783 [Sclerotinia sclerotiorum 1980 UF-70]
MAFMVSMAVIIEGQPQNSTELLADASAAYPKCALVCTAEILPTSGCSSTDVECICTNIALQHNVTACAQKTCTIPELLTTKNVTDTLCGAPVRDRTLTAELVGLIGVADLGLGKDIWTLPPQNITNILKFYYVSEVMYNAAIATIKISFCLMYIRLFPFKPYVYWVYGTLALCIGYGISFTVATIFQCTPVTYAWYQWDKLHEGFCGNFHLQVLMNAAFNVALDILIIALPVWNVTQLMMGWQKKATVIFSITRLANIGYFSLMELYVGIIIACIPALRPLAHKTLVVFNSITGHSRLSNSKARSPWSSDGDRFPRKRIIRNRDESILKETMVTVTDFKKSLV